MKKKTPRRAAPMEAVKLLRRVRRVREKTLRWLLKYTAEEYSRTDGGKA